MGNFEISPIYQCLQKGFCCDAGINPWGLVEQTESGNVKERYFPLGAVYNPKGGFESPKP